MKIHKWIAKVMGFQAKIDSALGHGEADYNRSPQERGIPVADEAGHLLVDGELVTRYVLGGSPEEGIYHINCMDGQLAHCHWILTRVPHDSLAALFYVCPLSRATRVANPEVIPKGNKLTGWGKIVDRPRGFYCPPHCISRVPKLGDQEGVLHV